MPEFFIGTDILSVPRIGKILKSKNKNRFKIKTFTKKEIEYCGNKPQPMIHYAGRFAAKEAFSKALGTGIRKGISLKNIIIFNDVYGKPKIKLKGSTYNYLKKKVKSKKYNIHLSLSDDEPWAQATVIISYR
mgnify:CR=1 FL=1